MRGQVERGFVFGFVHRADDVVLADDAHRHSQARKEREQVGEFLVGHGLGERFGHQGNVAALAVLDLARLDRDPLALGRLEDEAVGRVFDRKAGENAAVVEGDDQRSEVITDGSTGS